MMELNFFGRVPAALPKALAKKAVEEALKVARQKGEGGLGLVFMDEKRMAALNKKQRGCSGPTDVLSFSPAEFPGLKKMQPGLGDIVICPAYVRQDAAKSGISYPQQLTRVLIHGVLHLSGFDHATAEDEKTMFALQEKAIKACGL